MTFKNRPIGYAFVGGFFIFFDQLLKYLARTNQSYTYGTDLLGWQYYENPGIAFSLPVPMDIIIFLTPFVVLFLFLYWNSLKKPAQLVTLGCFGILSGALSNFVDRVLFGYTIDYFVFFTAVINFADIMISFGAIALIVGIHKQDQARSLTKKGK